MPSTADERQLHSLELPVSAPEALRSAKCTAASPEKYFPSMVTRVPPTVGPCKGATEVIMGVWIKVLKSYNAAEAAVTPDTLMDNIPAGNDGQIMGHE